MTSRKRIGAFGERMFHPHSAFDFFLENLVIFVFTPAKYTLVEVDLRIWSYFCFLNTVTAKVGPRLLYRIIQRCYIGVYVKMQSNRMNPWPNYLGSNTHFAAEVNVKHSLVAARYFARNLVT